MQSSDRRASPRFYISIPLHFQSQKSTEPECAAETLDVSCRGLCLYTDAPPQIGAIVTLRLRMPEMIMGWRGPEWRITSHVVHVESSSEPGRFDVGVQFDYYEAAAPRRGRLPAELSSSANRPTAHP